MTYSNFRNRKEKLDSQLDTHELQAIDELEGILDGYKELADDMLKALESTKLSDKQLYLKMKRLVEAASRQSKISSHDCYEKIWDEFWELHKQISVDIDWYDPDTTCEADITACFNAYKEIEWMFEVL